MTPGGGLGWVCFAAPTNDPPACPAWGWGQVLTRTVVNASRENRLRTSPPPDETPRRSALSAASNPPHSYTVPPCHCVTMCRDLTYKVAAVKLDRAETDRFRTEESN